MPRASSRTNSSRRWLIGLNAGLIALLGLVTLGPQALAQARSSARLPGKYLFVASPATGPGNSAPIFVLDTSNAELITLRWASDADELEPAGYRSIDRDAALDPGR